MDKEDIEFMLKAKADYTKICFQSNNYTSVDSHINCSNSLEEFVEGLNLREVWYSGTLETENYDRYMVIGR